MFDLTTFRFDRLFAATICAVAVLISGCAQQPDNAQATAKPATPTVTPAATPAVPSSASPATTVASSKIAATSEPSRTVPARTASKAAGASATSALGAPASSGAVITFAKELHDFGDIVDTETHRTTYPFTNTGTERLVITQVKAACGCTTPVLTKKVFEPGEGHEIQIEFDPKGKSGKTDKYITVFSNAVNGGEYKVKLTSNIQPMLDYERMHRIGTVPLGQGYQEIIGVKYSDPDLVFKNLTVNNEWVTAQVVDKGIIDTTDTGETVYRADIDLRVDEEAPWGLLYATRLTMSVLGSPRPDKTPVDYDYTMYITGSVFGKIEASPTIISLGTLKPGTPFEKFAELRRTDGEAFQITDVQIADASVQGLEVRVETLDPSRHRVFVHGTTQFTGSVKGQVIVTTDVPGEDVLSVRFSGFGRP